ncbi:MAG: very short patch repair endonuclease [Pseudomonadales bacterium]|nr:very short patch repair endonuclease [Pseudomonadales bacterium]
MVDVVDKKTRSRMMSGIRSSNTKPEILTRKALHRLGYRFRLDSRVGKIKPDVVLRRHRVAVFIHGCYWHQHTGCKLAYSDRRYSDKWKKKFLDNKQRDQRVLSQLKEEGWRVAVVWECTTRRNSEFQGAIKGLDEFIQTGVSWYFETCYRES